MTKKEYRKRLEEICTFDYWDYLNPNETAELKRDLKDADGVILPHSNFKASVRIHQGWYILRSYYTDVAMTDGTKIYKLWDGYSVTTMRHINEFCEMFSLPQMSKKEWIELPL